MKHVDDYDQADSSYYQGYIDGYVEGSNASQKFLVAAIIALLLGILALTL